MLETFTGLLAFSEQREDENLVAKEENLDYHGSYREFALQVDHCRQEGIWKDETLTAFISLHDSKLEAPAKEIGDTFFKVIDNCIQNSYRKRCSMDKVSLWPSPDLILIIFVCLSYYY